jgi:hypothetical protein
VWSWRDEGEGIRDKASMKPIAAMLLVVVALSLSGCIADERTPGTLTPVVVGTESPLECQVPGDADPAPPAEEWPVAKTNAEPGTRNAE